MKKPQHGDSKILFFLATQLDPDKSMFRIMNELKNIHLEK